MAVSPSLNLDHFKNKRIQIQRNFHAFCFWRSNLPFSVDCSSRKSATIKCRSANSTDTSCVVAREDFANDEDFIKAGGSQLLYVQMQQEKAMDYHSKIADKVFFLK